MATPQDWVNFSLQRPHYFPGQYLLDEDFELAHQYLSDRQRYINSRLHVAGIIEGLEVEAIASQTDGTIQSGVAIQSSVTIKSGTAIDGDGNLVILTKDTTRAINSPGWLCLRYHPQPNLLQQAAIPYSFTRFEDVPLLTVEATESTDGITIVLAKLSLENGQIKIDSSVRQYSGVKLPNGAEEIVLQSSGDALTVKGKLSILGALQLGDTTLTRISDTIDVIQDRIDVIPSEKAFKDYVDHRLFERLVEKKAPTTQEPPAVSTKAGADGKLNGWKTEGGPAPDPSTLIKFVAYKAGEAIPRLSLERDTGSLEVYGRIRAPHIESSNPMRHRMYPANPIIYQDIFDARDAGAIKKHGDPTVYNDTSYVKNLWNSRRIIQFGQKDPRDGGALITIPPGYDTAWVRVLGERWNEFKADFIDGDKEDLGYWSAGYRQSNCYCPDGSLSDGYEGAHQWVPIAAGRSGKLRLVDRYGSNGDGDGLWLSGLAFSKNPWGHATQAAVGYYWKSNGGDSTRWNWDKSNSTNWGGDTLTAITGEKLWNLRVPYVWTGRDKLLYIAEHNNEWNGCMHGDITVNGQPIERLLATYENPFACHWNSKLYNRYIAARIPAKLIPKPTAEAAPLLKVTIDMTKHVDWIHFREMGTHDLDVPYSP